MLPAGCTARHNKTRIASAARLTPTRSGLSCWSEKLQELPSRSSQPILRPAFLRSKPPRFRNAARPAANLNTTSEEDMEGICIAKAARSGPVRVGCCTKKRPLAATNAYSPKNTTFSSWFNVDAPDESKRASRVRVNPENPPPTVMTMRVNRIQGFMVPTRIRTPLLRLSNYPIDVLNS